MKLTIVCFLFLLFLGVEKSRNSTQVRGVIHGQVYRDFIDDEGFPDCFKVERIEDGLGSDNVSDYRCATSRNSKISIACVGDSITAGSHSSGRKFSYPSRLQSLLDSEYPEVYEVVNLGLSGSTLQKVSKPYWNSKQYEALASGKWDIVIIMLGTNDAKDNGSHGPPNWPHNCTGVTALDCSYSKDYASLLQVVQGLGKNAEGPSIHLAIPPPLMKQGAYGMNQTVINDILPKLIPKISAYNRLNTKPINVYSAFGGSKIWRDEFPPLGCSLDTSDIAECSLFCDKQSCDQCHPNDNGYFHMANIMKMGIGL